MVAGHPMTEAIWIHGIFWVLMNMTAQNSISIRWKICYFDRYDATPLKSWDSLSAMLTSEIERIFGLFDADGHCIDEDVPTTPVVI